DPGPVPAEREVYLAAQDAPGWRLEVDGREVPGRRVLGWARSFPVDAGGEATLSHSTPIGAQALNVAPVLAWVLVLGYLLRARSRPPEVPLSDPEPEIAAEGVQPRRAPAWSCSWGSSGCSWLRWSSSGIRPRRQRLWASTSAASCPRCRA